MGRCSRCGAVVVEVRHTFACARKTITMVGQHYPHLQQQPLTLEAWPTSNLPRHLHMLQLRQRPPQLSSRSIATSKICHCHQNILRCCCCCCQCCCSLYLHIAVCVCVCWMAVFVLIDTADACRIAARCAAIRCPRYMRIELYLRIAVYVSVPWNVCVMDG